MDLDIGRASWPRRHRWGSFTGGALPRSGALHYQLVVFPPGVTDRERAALRRLLAWPVTGTGLTVVLAVGLATVVPLTTALVAAALVHLGGYALLRHECRRQRSAVVVRHAEYVAGGDRADLRRCRRLESIASGLAAAERAHAAGALSAVELELLWGAFHRAAAAVGTERAGTLAS